MVDLHSGRWLLAVVALGLLLAGCGPVASSGGDDLLTSPLDLPTTDDLLASPLDSPTPIATSTLPPTAAPTATLTAVPTVTVAPASVETPLQPLVQLVVLHTNDNWGETEPCG